MVPKQLLQNDRPARMHALGNQLQCDTWTLRRHSAPPSEDEREGKEAFISVLSTLHCWWFYADVRSMMTSSVDDTIAFITDTSRSTADTIATTEDSKETSSTSKSITAAATAAGAAGAAAPVPFYINTWFHISHSPMKPTAQQIQDYADFQSPDRKPVTSLHRAGLTAPCWSIPMG